MTSWTGRIIGFLIGMFFIGPLAGVIGAVLGYIFIDKPRQFRRFNDAAAQRAFTTDANYNRNLIHHTFALMGYVARGAGRVNQQHIATAERLMQALSKWRLRPLIMARALNLMLELSLLICAIYAKVI